MLNTSSYACWSYTFFDNLVWRELNYLDILWSHYTDAIILIGAEVVVLAVPQ